MARYARVGVGLGGAAMRVAGARLRGGDRKAEAAALAGALGGLKGPLMKIAQLAAAIPDLLPAEYAAELQKLQSAAPPMGPAFVRRRMAAELGPQWRARFASFDLEPAAAASLGQVHRAVAHDGAVLACKLQYPDMQSAVAADLRQMELALALHRRLGAAIDASEAAAEIAERLYEELDYRREARCAALYRLMLADVPGVRVPAPRPELSTGRLLTLEWLEGRPLAGWVAAPQETRDRLARAMFHAWWRPFGRYGVIHGDPHPGNYAAFAGDDGEPTGVNLLDFGCIRIFPPDFVAGVVALYRGLLHDRPDEVMHAYRTWGFCNVTRELAGVLDIWARFICGPLLDDRERTIADGVAPGEYGRREAFRVHQELKRLGPLRVPRAFVFMDRAAVGLGAAFLRLDARLNFHRLFEETIAGFSEAALAERQAAALATVGLTGEG
ncbi:ABC1 kinase family protein [Camelimonas abortus]|uniref:ABC1 kinase family protein n=1 Tax=Camelimonas abortus TaxID=1017184 RepID=A0ABV7LDX9_9HYPH